MMIGYFVGHAGRSGAQAAARPRQAAADRAVPGAGQRRQGHADRRAESRWPRQPLAVGRRAWPIRPAAAQDRAATRPPVLDDRRRRQARRPPLRAGARVRKASRRRRPQGRRAAHAAGHLRRQRREPIVHQQLATARGFDLHLHGPGVRVQPAHPRRRSTASRHAQFLEHRRRRLPAGAGQPARRGGAGDGGSRSSRRFPKQPVVEAGRRQLSAASRLMPSGNQFLAGHEQVQRKQPGARFSEIRRRCSQADRGRRPGAALAAGCQRAARRAEERAVSWLAAPVEDLLRAVRLEGVVVRDRGRRPGWWSPDRAAGRNRKPAVWARLHLKSPHVT